MEPKAEHANCNICPLQNARYAPTSGPKNARVSLVSRSPGVHDVDAGAPFSGPSGEVVDYLLNKNGVKRAQIITTNVVLCQTDAPSKEAIEACRPRLESEIGQCETIIAAGTEAVTALTPFRSVSSARGYVHTRIANDNEQRIIAANNPALVLRESDTFPNLVTDFKLALNPLPHPKFPSVKVINDPDVARDTLREWNESFTGVVATDLEWSGTDIACAGFSTNGTTATVFGRKVIEDSTCFGLIKRFYELDTTHSCWHNGKSDTSVLWRNGIKGRVSHDTFLLSYALDEEPGRHSLDYLLQTKFGWPNYTPDSVNHFKKTGELTYYGTDEISIAKAEYELYEYNGWDAAGTFQLFDILGAEAAFADVYQRPYIETLLPASDAFRQIELNGFRFDSVGSANILEAEVLPKLTELIAEMQLVSATPILNPRSPKQMQALYYSKWGLKHNLRDKAKQKLSTSTGKEMREEVEGGRFTCNTKYRDTLVAFASLHRSYAKIERQRSNYFQSLIERVDNNGYIHPWFNIGGTATGRTSSTDPNFQNITREGVEGIQSVRTLFLPSEGNVLIQADYSQAELRTMAQLSQDPNLLGIYNDNTRSLHKERAAAFYGPQYTKNEYVLSKNINFGVSYGQSATAFAQMYHIPKEEAQAYIDSWWREFPQLKKWIEGVKKQALTGEIISPLGYHRRFHLITKENLEEVQREGVNFLPQNTAGGFTIRAVVELINAGVRIVNTVHDSIIADVPEDEAQDTALLMKLVMEKQPVEILDWKLPFTADVSIGDTWANVREVELAI